MNAPASPVNSEITSEETVSSSARKGRIPWLAVLAGILLSGYVAAYLLLSTRSQLHLPPGMGRIYQNLYAGDSTLCGWIFLPAEIAEDTTDFTMHLCGYSGSLGRTGYFTPQIFATKSESM